MPGIGNDAADNDLPSEESFAEIQTVVIELQNNETLECNVIGIFDYKNKDYIALLPLGDDQDVMLFEYYASSPEPLNDIESDEEYAEVVEEFIRQFNEAYSRQEE
ncbi:MAG: DUF1292 domain-containing protein [Clostridiales bacterium]|nr:DUF1292 domain-containing protein [Clostridiales bacterium]